MPGDGIVVGFRFKVFWLPGGLPSTFPNGFIGGVPIFCHPVVLLGRSFLVTAAGTAPVFHRLPL
jgi:hypothetical protein